MVLEIKRGKGEVSVKLLPVAPTTCQMKNENDASTEYFTLALLCQWVAPTFGAFCQLRPLRRPLPQPLMWRVTLAGFWLDLFEGVGLHDVRHLWSAVSWLRSPRLAWGIVWVVVVAASLHVILLVLGP